MSAGKGVSPASFVKHEAIERLAKGQTARARLFLNPGDRIAVIDMHAGDGRGVVQPEPDMFRGDESTATPVLATEIGEALRRDGFACDTILCERNRERRAMLAELAARGAIVIGNHDTLPTLRYRWALILNDPNGPGKHGDETLRRIAREVPRADFLIVVNEGACDRILGVRTPSDNPEAPVWSRTAGGISKKHADTAWRLLPQEWARRLGRRQVLVSKLTYGSKAMKGRILLVSNAPCRTPRGYSVVSLLARGGGASAAPSQSATSATRGRDRGHPRLPFAAGF